MGDDPYCFQHFGPAKRSRYSWVHLSPQETRCDVDTRFNNEQSRTGFVLMPPGTRLQGMFRFCIGLHGIKRKRRRKHLYLEIPILL